MSITKFTIIGLFFSWAGYVFISCSGTDSSFWIPEWNDISKQDDTDGWTIFNDQLSFSQPVSSMFSNDFEAHGWTFISNANSTITLEISHSGTSTKLNTTLFLYGPADSDDQFDPNSIAWDDDSGWGKNAKIENIFLEKKGKYLALVATKDGKGRGNYRLELQCVSDVPSSCGPDLIPSCMNQCGNVSEAQCSCDSECNFRNDCCFDMSLACDFRASDIDISWRTWLEPEFHKDTFLELIQFLDHEYARYSIYPPKDLVFNALIRSPLDQVKVVILGQDPYHGPGQAHGLSFSVPEGVAIPPSLRNIFKEVSTDIMNIDPSSEDFQYPPSGNLEPWADQGVLLLNAVLTVQESTPNSHADRGWEPFTDKIISLISQHKEHVVFLLWGKFAQKKASLIDESKHLILKAAHPSPYSASYGFFGCQHFSLANQYLEQHGLQGIDWYYSIWTPIE